MKDPEHASIEHHPYFLGWLPVRGIKGIPAEHGRPTRSYNPALCLLPDGTLWLVWRVEMNTGRSQLACGVLDLDNVRIRSPRWLDVGHDNPEDPRLIRCGDAVWLNYLEVKFTAFQAMTSQVIRRVDPDLQEVVGKRIVPPIGKNEKGVEKNWTMFAVPGRPEPLLCYSPESGGVYSLAGKEVTPPKKVPWRHPCGSWSGRSQAHLVGNRYVAIGGGAYYWPGHLKRYFLSAWSFDAKAPFHAKEVSEKPLIWASEDDPRIPSPIDPKHQPCVVFTGGAQPMDDGTWLVPVGVHDSEMALFRIPVDEFNLVPLSRLDTEKRRPTYQEALQKVRAKLSIKPPKLLAKPPEAPYAIVYPWKHDASAWQELRFSLRSIDKFFEDKKCPIYILGTKQPNFLLHSNQRVQFIPTWSYWEALAHGLQLARKVLWMNDDIFLLRSTRWEDCEGALYLGDIDPSFVGEVGPQANPWREGVAEVLRRLQARGLEKFRVYSTHTPYVFERSKSVPLIKEMGVWDKMPFEMLYFHLHGEPRKLGGHEKVMDEPFGKARFLNVADHKLSPELKAEISALLPDYAPWELPRPFQA